MKITLENLTNTVSKSVNIGTDELTEDVSLINDIGIDSIETVKLCKDLIDEFGIKIDVLDIKKADSIKNIYELLKDRS